MFAVLLKFIIKHESPTYVIDVQNFVKNNPNLNYDDVNGHSLLWHVLDERLLKNKENVDKLTAFILSHVKPDGQPLISVEALKKVINSISPSVFTNDRVVPLLNDLIMSGHVDIIQCLLSHAKFPKDALTLTGSTGNPLITAITHFGIESQRNPDGTYSYEHQAFQNEIVSVVRSLMTRVDFPSQCFTQKNSYGENALMAAIRMQGSEVVNVLLSKTDLPNECFTQKNDVGDNVLLVAIKTRNLAIIKALLERKDLPRKCFTEANQKGENALTLAIQLQISGVIDAITQDSELLADCCKQSNGNHQNALALAVRMRNRELIDKILNNAHLSKSAVADCAFIMLKEAMLSDNRELFNRILFHRLFSNECLATVNSSKQNILMLALSEKKLEFLQDLFCSGKLPKECFSQTNKFDENFMQMLVKSEYQNERNLILNSANAPIGLAQFATDKVKKSLSVYPVFSVYKSLNDYVSGLWFISRNHVWFVKDLLEQPQLTLAMIKDKITQYSSLPQDKKLNPDGDLTRILLDLKKIIPDVDAVVPGKMPDPSQYLDLKDASLSKSTTQATSSQSATSSTSYIPQGVPPEYGNVAVASTSTTSAINMPHPPMISHPDEIAPPAEIVDMPSTSFSRLERFTTQQTPAQLLARNRVAVDDDGDLDLPSAPSDVVSRVDLNLPSVPSDNNNDDESEMEKMESCAF